VFQLTAMSERRTIGAARLGDLEIGMELSNRGQHLARPDPHRAPGQLGLCVAVASSAGGPLPAAVTRLRRAPPYFALYGVALKMSTSARQTPSASRRKMHKDFPGISMLEPSAVRTRVILRPISYATRSPSDLISTLSRTRS
jgi:hypothetical protein